MAVTVMDDCGCCGAVEPGPGQCCEPAIGGVLCATVTVIEGNCELVDYYGSDVPLMPLGGQTWRGSRGGVLGLTFEMLDITFFCCPANCAGGDACSCYKVAVHFRSGFTSVSVCVDGLGGEICPPDPPISGSLELVSCSCEPPEWVFHVTAQVQHPSPCQTTQTCVSDEVVLEVVIAECAGPPPPQLGWECINGRCEQRWGGRFATELECVLSGCLPGGTL